MISYDVFWETMKRKGMSQYRLTKDFKISESVFTRMRRRDYLGLRKVEDLCRALDCDISDIVRYVPDEKQ
ncbi:MAG: helix-turn-helix transcriptional regulator [Oscillospiraceae bacterium]|jgi:DNA-binding Xre family transcriptional regulator|nr:helix-turn-helix transcriptional regulator [Oscillospiraceae bacterium]